MHEHSETAWKIASQYSHVLASETRDLAAWIDKVIADEREACAKFVEEFAKHPDTADVAPVIAQALRERNQG